MTGFAPAPATTDRKPGQPKAFIRLDHLTLDFPIFHGGARSLKKSLFGKVKRPLQLSRGSRTGGEVRMSDNAPGVLEVRAISDLSLTIRSGERVGLVGHNGAGKSTLLRVLGGIYLAQPGMVTVRGSVETLIDTNSGMNPALTGRENIYLLAQHKALRSAQLKQLEQDVEAFAELGEFMDLPLRLYSSGMAIRLGFGLATAIAPQILLMDEWFMAGDARFQDKARARLASVVDGAEILVITSHSLPVLEEWCSRIIWLEGGRVKMDGPASDVLKAYAEAMNAHV
ncbi:MAG: ATP-binding cassette domain-containing protein [Acetobacter sp.]|uniref:ABC transporter ATP-binding protein n=1 Tax=unclassified Acetobacter TaxID=2628570 RepID=UPI0025BE713C|nr:ATP-binding cassette domain-containing protein [Acetobacter sp. UBA5411]